VGDHGSLPAKRRTARAAVGLAFLGLAASRPSRPVALLAAWLGISHLVAACTGYRGCPELGAIPSVLFGRQVGSWCGPWELLDRLVATPAPADAVGPPGHRHDHRR
jgi:hypothetical protein